MKMMKKTVIPALLALVIALSVIPARAAEHDLDAVIKDVAASLQKTVTSPGIAQTGGDWTIFALVRSGATVPDEYYQLYYKNAADHIRKCDGVLSSVKHSEYSRVTLALAALGADARDVGGIDIFSPMFDSNLAATQGINGPIFALIALGAMGYAQHDICPQYIDYILSKCLADGGFAMSGEIADPDATALALTALSRYSGREDVSAAIETGLDRLSRLQRDTGGFTSYSVINSESVSQAIIAISTLDIPIDDARFVKSGSSMLDNLMTYYIPGKGFEHELGRGFDLMATEQALLALTALRRQQEKLPALYDLSDVSPKPVISTQNELPGKHPDVTVPGKLPEMDSLSDISGIAEETAIYALMRRGIVTGYPDGSFQPDKTLTRSEFAAIITRALGLPSDADYAAEFTDIVPGAWYYDAVCTAARYGIIQGRGDGTFAPGGTLTRQEAAVMIARAAKLCGMDTEYNADAARSVLSQFTDYRQIADWAWGAMAFCYDNNLLDQADIESRPNDDILRREMAELSYRLLVAASLIEPGE